VTHGPLLLFQTTFAEYPLDFRVQPIAVEGFRQYGLDPRRTHSYQIRLGIPGTQHDNGEFNTIVIHPKFAGQLVTIHNGHLIIGNNQIKILCFDFLKCFLPVRGLNGRETLVLQELCDVVTHHIRIIHGQDRFGPTFAPKTQ